MTATLLWRSFLSFFSLQTLRNLTVPITGRTLDLAVGIPLSIPDTFADNDEFVDAGIEDNLAAY
jgi:hypothetical protein